ncbi:MAG: hypothetical protein ACKO5F_15145 [Synechococcus sp.]
MTSGSSPDLDGLLAEASLAEDSQCWDVAACLLREAVDHHPGQLGLALRAANAFCYGEQPAEALRLYRSVAMDTPQAAAPYLGMGNALRDLNRFEESDQAFRLCRRLQDTPQAASNHASLLLGLERYEDAFELSERRFEIAGYSEGRRSSAAGPGPRETTLVWSEQGLGDTLQYLRWIPALHRELRSREGKLVVEVEAGLVRLVQHAFAQLVPVPTIRPLPSPLTPLPAETRGFGLLSLPRLLGGAPLPVGCSDRGDYLRPADAKPQDPWPTERPRIGLTWASGRKGDSPFQWREYRKRSLNQSQLQHLCEGLLRLGCGLVLVQQGPDRDLCDLPGTARITTIDPQGDFADTAEAILDTDLMISVDTSVAHLTGALGHEGWVLLPWSADPRWLRDRTDTPWYPSLRLFRQAQPGNWDGVVERVLEAVARRFQRPVLNPSDWR